MKKKTTKKKVTAKKKGKSSRYVDGFVLTVKKDRLDDYRKMATLGCKIWTKHGALEYKECVMDDPKPEGVKWTFPLMAKAKPDEIVVFAFIVYKSRADRDRVNAKVMNDPEMNDPKYANTPMPFDMKRMAFGGFEVLVEA
jgi:uncharacterized protein YbaA (DUF1428 family)